MRTRRALRLVPLLLLACSAEAPVPLGAPSAVLRWSPEGEHAFELRLGEQRLGALRPSGAGWALLGEAPLAELRVSEQALADAHPYPRRIRREATLATGGATFRDEHTLLAPAAPLSVEGLGLVVADDAPGLDDAEHETLRRWLGAQGLPADTTLFEALHERETGRELRVWYEISGRRVDGRFGRTDAPEPLATIDSLFRSEAGGLKIHHQRPGENGRFTYHRKSLELADRIRAEGLPELVTHQCGCYGYAIAADLTTLGDALYRVEADWLDDRVGAEFFVGFERRSSFPWLGLGERRRMRDLARRARAFTLKDARGVRFAELTLELPADPPRPGLGPIGYRFDQFDAADRRRPLAHVSHTPAGITLALHGAGFDEGIEQLDRLLAALPVQVMRGDGIRDSQLAEIERLVDAVRLLRVPDESRLADLASDVDAASAARKVEALLAPERARFALAASERPPTPIAGPGALRTVQSSGEYGSGK